MQYTYITGIIIYIMPKSYLGVYTNTNHLVDNVLYTTLIIIIVYYIHIIIHMYHIKGLERSNSWLLHKEVRIPQVATK